MKNQSAWAMVSVSGLSTLPKTICHYTGCMWMKFSRLKLKSVSPHTVLSWLFWSHRPKWLWCHSASHILCPVNGWRWDHTICCYQNYCDDIIPSIDTCGTLKTSICLLLVCHVINNGCPEHTKDKFSFGRISRASANFIIARRVDLKCSERWGGILRVAAAGVREGREKEEDEEETPRSPHPTYPTAIYSRLPEMSQQHHLAPHVSPHQPSPNLKSSLGDSLPSPHLPSGQQVGVTQPETGIRQVWPKPQQAMALLLDGSPVAAAYFCLLHRKFKRRRKRRSERKGTAHCLPSQFLQIFQ